MIVDAILVGLIFYFTFPLLTGYCARQYGRSFGLWFAIGCFLPVVSFLLIFSLIYLDEKMTPANKLSKREKMESALLVKELTRGLRKAESGSGNEQRKTQNHFWNSANLAPSLAWWHADLSGAEHKPDNLVHFVLHVRLLFSLFRTIINTIRILV